MRNLYSSLNIHLVLDLGQAVSTEGNIQLQGKADQNISFLKNNIDSSSKKRW